MEIPKNPLTEPFSKIALCLSGGGYRASFFSLGILSYLAHAKYDGVSLLDRVVTISTVSGGTITGVRYALDQHMGRDFTHTFTYLKDVLVDKDMIEEGLKVLNDSKEWKDTPKRRNLINAVSKVYHKHLCEELDMGVFQKSTHKTHLENLIFNATEFDNGIAFRFKYTNVNMVFGNGYVKGYLKDHETAEIKLGDIVAASSCFPGGFEPIAFPDDFIKDKESPLAGRINTDIRQKVNDLEKKLDKEKEEHKKAEIIEEIEKVSNFFNPVTGLMDGGIYDNQGTDSILVLENNYKIKKPYHQLILISDVASYFVDNYTFDKGSFKGKTSNITLTHINHIIFTLLSVIFIAGVFFYLAGSTIGTTAAATAFVGLGGVSWYIRRKLRSLKNGVPSFADKYFPYLAKIRIGALQRFVKERITSVMLMTSVIFLKGVRGLHQKVLYQDPKWINRRIYSKIYFLKERIDRGRIAGASPQLTHMANMVRKMPTTLWFTKEEKEMGMPDNLIACGQVTLCYNLLEYVNKLLKVEDDSDITEEEDYSRGNEYLHITDTDELDASEIQKLKDLKSFLEKESEEFNQNPLRLVSKYYDKEVLKQK